MHFPRKYATVISRKAYLFFQQKENLFVSEQIKPPLLPPGAVVTVVMTVEDAETASNELLRSLFRNDPHINPTGELHRVAGCAVHAIIAGDANAAVTEIQRRMNEAIAILKAEAPIVPTA